MPRTSSFLQPARILRVIQASLIRFAPALFILIWASGYVVAKYAAPHAEPMTFLLWRFLGTAVLMLALAVVAGARWPSARDAAHLAVAGVGMQACYLGGVWVAISQGMPAGVSALIVNLQPSPSNRFASTGTGR